MWSSIVEHREKIGPSLRALGESKLPTATALIAHLEVLSLANFVNACANGPELIIIPPANREEYHLGENYLIDLLAEANCTVRASHSPCNKRFRGGEEPSQPEIFFIFYYFFQFFKIGNFRQFIQKLQVFMC